MIHQIHYKIVAFHRICIGDFALAPDQERNHFLSNAMLQQDLWTIGPLLEECHSFTLCDVWGDACVRIFNDISKMSQTLSNLIQLDLRCCQVSRTGALILSGLLKHEAIPLRDLNLEGNNLGDRGVDALAGGLQNNTTLRFLDLGSNLIGVNGVTSLATVLETNQMLSRLSLGNEYSDT